ncbi:MAG: response regulator transcription factor [Candidatus Pacebacteria bacterium]|nr:response regulator transcription factor [Candidatus Paceibacterota bacterium]
MDKRILIIEDEPDIREAMAEAVEQAGFQVSTAENGQVGFAKAIEEKPDLILLDIIMPIMDGHETLRKLRQDPWGQSARVIMLTSMDDVQNIGSAHENKITDYIIKAHSSLDEIVAKVRMAIYAD